VRHRQRPVALHQAQPRGGQQLQRPHPRHDGRSGLRRGEQQGPRGTSNDGSDDSTATVTVECPDIKVTKEPDAGDAGSSVSAGETATFTIKVENVGDGDATNVELSDPLPDGIDWSDDSADCTIAPDSGTTGQVLSCSFGDLASGDSVLITLTGTADKADCGTLENTASATADNEPSDALGNNEDDGAIEVKCATIEITKEADDDTVNATDQIGFLITVSNSGTGTAFDVEATDTLPAGFDWSIESQDGGWTLLNGELTYTAASLAAGASSWVHIVADTTKDDCGPVLNAASVTAGNDGEDSASDTTTILCADIEIAKTADDGTENAGDQIGFTITVSNVGDGDASGAVATARPPAVFAWSIESQDGGWSIDNGVLGYEAATGRRRLVQRPRRGAYRRRGVRDGAQHGVRDDHQRRRGRGVRLRHDQLSRPAGHQGARPGRPGQRHQRR
jgi:uncharacterized repeat protein (TIGR01451 family)